MTARALYVDANGRAPEPRTPTIKVVCNPGKRFRHQEFWPEVEARSTVTFIKRETWGTDSVTYEIVAREVVDIRDGHTSEAFEEAQRKALASTERMACEIRASHPHPYVNSRKN